MVDIKKAKQSLNKNSVTVEHSEGSVISTVGIMVILAELS